MHYLDELDDAHVPAQRRLLAALGPKVLRLAAERTAGAHPYLTTPEHTREAREILGAAPLLAPEHKVVVEPDLSRGRAIGRQRVAPHLGLVNYTNRLRRLGFTDTDLTGGGSDHLIDAVVAHGDAATLATRVREHLDAGADHVSVQLVTERTPTRSTATAAGWGAPWLSAGTARLAGRQAPCHGANASSTSA